MRRSTFLTVVAVIAQTVGLIALFLPAFLLESKGVVSNPAANVWMSETGMLLFAVGLIVFWLRKEPNSLALKAVLSGVVVIQIGLLLIEVLAYFRHAITEISGIVPNCILHVVLIVGLGFYVSKMKNKEMERKVTKSNM